MGSEQSQASGRVVCQAGVLTFDGKKVKQIVDIKQDTTYTNHDPSSMLSMMSQDVRAAEERFEIAVRGVNALAEQGALRQINYNGQN